MSVKSLFPVPSVVLVLASEDNRLGAEGCHTFGVHSYDLQAMADGDIKVALEGMAHALHQIRSRPEVQVMAVSAHTLSQYTVQCTFGTLPLSTTFQHNLSTHPLYTSSPYII